MGLLAQKMQGMVEEAIRIIQGTAHNVSQTKKLGYAQIDGDEPDDYATEGDFAAQNMYKTAIQDDPLCAGFGIVGEEGLNVPCTHATEMIHFIIDPVDGTKAYWRKQSHGVGTMIAFVVNDVVLAVYIGNINTGEIYGYARNPDVLDEFVVPPTRIRFGKHSKLKAAEQCLGKQYLHAREAPHKIIELVSLMVGNGAGQLFKDLTVDGGSIGICVARLWAGEVGAIAMKTATHETPWDRAPIIGFNHALGYVTFRAETDLVLRELVQKPSLKVLKNDTATGNAMDLIIHKSKLPELATWLKTSGLPEFVLAQ